jgi:hypothetical protein
MRDRSSVSKVLGPLHYEVSTADFKIMNSIKYCLLVALALLYPLNSNADSRQLFNGKDLSGWTHVGFGKFLVEDGYLRTVGGIGVLWFDEEKIGNAIVRVVYKTGSHEDNSGVFVRIPGPPDDPWMPVHKGLEIQINEAGKTEYHSTGSIYTFTKATSQPAREGEWNTMEITLDGASTVVHINGIFVSEYTEGDVVPPKDNDGDPDRGLRPITGFIGLQNHPQGKTVYFKEISVHPVKN